MAALVKSGIEISNEFGKNLCINLAVLRNALLLTFGVFNILFNILYIKKITIIKICIVFKSNAF